MKLLSMKNKLLPVFFITVLLAGCFDGGGPTKAEVAQMLNDDFKNRAVALQAFTGLMAGMGGRNSGESPKMDMTMAFTVSDLDCKKQKDQPGENYLCQFSYEAKGELKLNGEVQELADKDTKQAVFTKVPDGWKVGGL
jgi:hypothetical protein